MRFSLLIGTSFPQWHTDHFDYSDGSSVACNGGNIAKRRSPDVQLRSFRLVYNKALSAGWQSFYIKNHKPTLFIYLCMLVTSWKLLQKKGQCETFRSMFTNRYRQQSVHQRQIKELPSFYSVVNDYIPETDRNKGLVRKGHVSRKALSKEDRQRYINFEKLMLALVEIGDTKK